MRLIRSVAIISCLWLASASIWGLIIQIGDGNVEDMGLPWNVSSRYSYVQQVYPADAIGVSGTISSIGFEYTVGSNVYFEANRELRVLMGLATQDHLSQWIPVAELTEVFNGLLDYEDYSAGVPGSGWLTIQLQTPFVYNNDLHLLIAIDENSADYGAVNDDFMCSLQPANRALRFSSMSINPSPEEPPLEPVHSLSYLANLRLEISGSFYQPYQPSPADQTADVPLDTSFSWQSDAQSFDLYLGTNPDSLVCVAEDLQSSSWQPEQDLELGQTYYWQVFGIQGVQAYPSEIWSFATTGAALSPPRNLSGILDANSIRLSWQAPSSGAVESYQVWRNDAILATSIATGYSDAEIEANNSYTYKIRAIGPQGNISGFSNEISIEVGDLDPMLIIREGFEYYPAFTRELTNWQNIDLDAAATWGLDDYSFPEEEEAGAWLVFAPGQTSPPMAQLTAYLGTQMLASFSSLSPPSSDWLISPVCYLGSSPSLSFYARSHTSIYGLERLRVYVSGGSEDPDDFQLISGGDYLQVPAAWTDYYFDLSAWENQSVRVAFEACSWDALALYLDHIELRGWGGSGTEDNHAPSAAYRLYPNPSRGYWRLQSAAKTNQELCMRVFDLRGRLVDSILLEPNRSEWELEAKLGSGLYLLRLEDSSGSLVQSFKQVICR